MFAMHCFRPRSHRRWYTLFVCCLLASAADAKPRALGWLEWAWLEPGHIRLKAKLDTGAKTSSIHAEDIEPFERDGATWVRFRIPLSERPDDTTYDHDIVYERRVSGMKLIKDHVLAPAKRYVVERELCVGGRHFTTPMTLADRSRFNYPLLLGRVAMEGRIMIDPARKYTANRSCPKTPQSQPQTD